MFKKRFFSLRFLISCEGGFTLVEIITVLIIVGILAALAVPKFMDLSQDANDKAIEGALAEGLSTCSIQFARLALSTGAAPGVDAVATAATAEPPGSDDFNYSFTGNTSVVTVTVSWNTTNTGRTGSASALWSSPN